MPTIFVENYQEFATRHGGEPVTLENQRRLFADGAICDLEGDQRREPPSDTISLLRLQERYWKQRVKEAEDHFTTYRGRIAQQLGFAAQNPDLPVPDQGALDHLKLLKARAESMRKALQEIRDRLGETDYGRRRRQESNHEFERQAEISSLTSKLSEITLDGIIPKEQMPSPAIQYAIDRERQLIDKFFARSIGIHED